MVPSEEGQMNKKLAAAIRAADVLHASGEHSEAKAALEELKEHVASLIESIETDESDDDGPGEDLEE